MIDKPEINDILGKITDMPVLPTVVARLTRLIADPNATATDINVALSSDPGLVTKILKLVNSSYYGFSRRITTITNAVVILGFNQVRNLALSTFIFDRFASSGAAGFDVNGFWRHSIGVAFTGAKIARRLDAKLEEDAFICGLLHDLGKFVLAQNAPGAMNAILNVVRRDDILFLEAEAKRLNFNHAGLGAAIMEHWNLPERLVEVVRNHHAPFGAPETAVLLGCVTNLADIIARSLLMGNGGDERIPLLAEDVWKRIGLDWRALDGIIRNVADEYSKSDAFFSMK